MLVALLVLSVILHWPCGVYPCADTAFVVSVWCTPSPTNLLSGVARKDNLQRDRRRHVDNLSPLSYALVLCRMIVVCVV